MTIVTSLMYERFIGIDYSGARNPLSRSGALQVYSSRIGKRVARVAPPSSARSRHRNWCRKEIADWLIDRILQEETCFVGIDHGFSFPISYFRRNRIGSWEEFLVDFTQHWPTDREHIEIDQLRNEKGGAASKRGGSATEYRLTERWSSSAKSVFHFDVQGSVAKSTHAGLPWLWQIRQSCSPHVHFWPFDGWKPESGKSVIAETFPSLFRNRYPRGPRTPDQQDAYSVARWLSESASRGALARYLDPPLLESERKTADLEGWILGIT